MHLLWNIVVCLFTLLDLLLDRLGSCVLANQAPFSMREGGLFWWRLLPGKSHICVLSKGRLFFTLDHCCKKKQNTLLSACCANMRTHSQIGRAHYMERWGRCLTEMVMRRQHVVQGKMEVQCRCYWTITCGMILIDLFTANIYWESKDLIDKIKL